MTTASRKGKNFDPRSESVLKKLIHLKRQNTEKRLARANEAIAALDCDIRKRRAELSDLDQRSLGDLVGSLAQTQKYIEFTLSEIERLAGEKEDLLPQLAQVKNELKCLLHSEDVITNML